MGTAVGTLDKDRVGTNLFRNYVSSDVYSGLEAILPTKSLPWIERGWRQDMKMRYQQALSLPIFLDEEQTRRSFPITDTSRIDIHRIADHFARSLYVRKILGEKLRLPEDFYTEGVCALGYDLVSHHASAEFGTTMTVVEKGFSDIVVDATVELTIKRFEKVKAEKPEIWNKINLDDYLNVKASFPRGRNTGFPFVVPSSDRLMNDAIMALDAAFATAIYQQPGFHEAFSRAFALAYIVFSRYQHTGRAVPMHLCGQDMMSYFFEPRRRIINAGAKPISLSLKPLIKWFTVIRQQTPEGDQDRSSLRDRARAADEIYCIDSSRFDLHIGGKKLLQACTVMWRVVKHFYPNFPDHMFEVLCKELTLPQLYDTGYEHGVMRIGRVANLPSGANPTSVGGSFICFMQNCEIVQEIKHYSSAAGLAGHFLKSNQAATSGDDNVNFLIKALCTAAQFDAAIPAVNERLGVDMAREKPDKYVGYEFNDPKGVSKEVNLYHSSRAFNNLMFPERPRRRSFCALCTRYLIATSKDAFDAMAKTQRFMTDEKYMREIYRELDKQVIPIIKPFYETHPNGAMRQFFATWPAEENALKDNFLFKELYKDIDEILDVIGHGASADMDMNLVGVDIGDNYEDEMPTTSLFEASMTFIDKLIESSSTSSRKNDNGQFENVRSLMARMSNWLQIKDPFEMLDKVSREMSFVMRSVRTSEGIFFVSKK